MKITQIEVMRVFVPWKDTFQEPMRIWRKLAGTTPEEEDAYIIVQVHTDEGITGIGEGGRSVAEAKAESQQFLGQDPLKLDIYSLRPPWAHAMFDIVGKALAVPAYRLLGSKVRDAVPVAYWSPHQPVNLTRVHAQESLEGGFAVHKVKARPEDVIEQVKAIAEVVGDAVAIRLDPNCHFDTLAQTVKIDRELEGYNIECFEDPFPKDRMSLYRLAREKCRIPIALHSGSLPLILDALRLEAIDYLNTGGPPGHVRKTAALAEAGSIPLWSEYEGHCLDIGAAFDVHVCATLAGTMIPCDILPFVREAGITKEGMVPVKGMLAVPEGPGLGVTLDPKLVAKYRVE